MSLPSDNSNNGANGHAKPDFPSYLNTNGNSSIPKISSNGSSDKTSQNFYTNITPEILKPDHLSDASNAQHTKPPAEYKDNIWQLGWTDGRYGQPKKTTQDILHHQTRLERIESIKKDQLEIAKWRSLKKTKEEQRQRLESRFNQVNKEYTRLWDIVSNIKDDGSIILAGIYLTISILLLLADVPLSLSLVTVAFKLVSNGILGQFGPYFLAIGIAFSGIFIKYFLDEVIFAPRIEEKKQPQTLKKVSLWIVLGFYIFTIIVLGVFREQTYIRKEVERNYPLVANESDQKKLEDKETELKERRQRAFEKSQSEHLFTELAFVVITLMLPLIGGITFSAGWYRLQKAVDKYTNRLKLKLIKYSYSRLEKKLNIVSREFYEAAEMLTSVDSNHKLEAEMFEEEDSLAGLLQNLYAHGYERGSNIPETLNNNESLYERCRTSLEKLLAKKTRRSTWNIE